MESIAAFQFIKHSSADNHLLLLLWKPHHCLPLWNQTSFRAVPWLCDPLTAVWNVLHCASWSGEAFICQADTCPTLQGQPFCILFFHGTVIYFHHQCATFTYYSTFRACSPDNEIFHKYRYCLILFPSCFGTEWIFLQISPSLRGLSTVPILK